MTTWSKGHVTWGVGSPRLSLVALDFFFFFLFLLLFCPIEDIRIIKKCYFVKNHYTQIQVYTIHLELETSKICEACSIVY